MDTQGAQPLYEYYSRPANQHPQPPAPQDIGEPTAEDKAALDRWWRAGVDPEPPLPPGWRKKPHSRPLQIEWIGKAAPRQDQEPVESEAQIGMEQNYAMVRDDPTMPDSMSRHFRQPVSMNPRIGWRGTMPALKMPPASLPLLPEKVLLLTVSVPKSRMPPAPPKPLPLLLPEKVLLFALSCVAP
jgi:hypothetical protein